MYTGEAVFDKKDEAEIEKKNPQKYVTAVF